MMTAPSTISPKSMAPRLIKLPDSPSALMTVTANNKASGMVVATTMPARKSPSKSSKMAITNSAPSSRFLTTVRTVRSTSTERS